jgi:hypothetical protein
MVMDADIRMGYKSTNDIFLVRFTQGIFGTDPLANYQ